jgi:hypothetical protein
MTTTSEQLFDQVTETIHQRGSKYGHPYPQHKRISELWSAYLGYPITANQVAMCMAMVKISRSVESPQYIDNYADALGYIAISKTCQDAMADSALDWQE